MPLDKTPERRQAVLESCVWQPKPDSDRWSLWTAPDGKPARQRGGYRSYLAAKAALEAWRSARVATLTRRSSPRAPSGGTLERFSSERKERR